MGKTRARTPAAGITLDTSALIALDRGDKRMIARLQQAVAQRRTFRVPSGALARAWRDRRTQVTLGCPLRPSSYGCFGNGLPAKDHINTREDQFQLGVWQAADAFRQKFAINRHNLRNIGDRSLGRRIGSHCYREADSVTRLMSARRATSREEEMYWSLQ